MIFRDVVVTFNTHRQYSKEGQIITAKWDGSTHIAYFVDHTRGISGCFEAAHGRPYSELDLPRFMRMLMGNYDRGNYGPLGAHQEDYIANLRLDKAKDYL
jgi:hypothetical protein